MPLSLAAGPWRLPAIAVLVLVCAATLAWSGATGDSVTVDEPSHPASGYAALASGDFTLSPDHPPLGRLALAMPLLAQSVSWRAGGTRAWQRGGTSSLSQDASSRSGTTASVWSCRAARSRSFSSSRCY